MLITPISRIPSAARASTAIVPEPRCALSIRAATLGDLPFLDSLQKTYNRELGYFPRKQFEGYIAMNAILLGEDEAKNPLEYCIARDRYMGHDDVGVVYQLCVAPGRQRHLVGAALVKATFERAAYGCKLFCCWCAQDLTANYFWESLGFVPIAFRTGSRGRMRTHIFWQRRVHEGDTRTPWWYPHQTKGGAIREDRLVFPIPPGIHWRDAKPVVLPGENEPRTSISGPANDLALNERLPDGRGSSMRAPTRPTHPPAPQVSVAQRMAIVRSQSKHLGGLPPGKAAVITGGGLRYIDRGDYTPEPTPAPESKPKRPPRPSASKHDAQQTAFVRELRDRYLEQVNATGPMLLEAGKYDVSRALEGVDAAVDAVAPVTISQVHRRALPAVSAVA